MHILIRHSLHIEPDGGNRGDSLPELKLEEDGCKFKKKRKKGKRKKEEEVRKCYPSTAPLFSKEGGPPLKLVNYLIISLFSGKRSVVIRIRRIREREKEREKERKKRREEKRNLGKPQHVLGCLGVSIAFVSKLCSQPFSPFLSFLLTCLSCRVQAKQKDTHILTAKEPFENIAHCLYLSER